MNRLCVTVLSVIFYYYPSLLTTILSLFACYPIDPATPGSDELYPQYAQVSNVSSGHRHRAKFALQVILTCFYFSQPHKSAFSQLKCALTCSEPMSMQDA